MGSWGKPLNTRAPHSTESRPEHAGQRSDNIHFRSALMWLRRAASVQRDESAVTSCSSAPERRGPTVSEYDTSHGIGEGPTPLKSWSRKFVPVCSKSRASAGVGAGRRSSPCLASQQGHDVAPPPHPTASGSRRYDPRQTNVRVLGGAASRLDRHGTNHRNFGQLETS